MTGGTSGIGKATVELLAREGARVLFTGRRQEIGASIAAALVQSGLTVEYYSLDHTDADATSELVERISTRYGRIDGLQVIRKLSGGLKSAPVRVRVSRR